MNKKSSKDILEESTQTLPDRPSTIQFVYTFLNYVGAADFDTIEEDEYPELNVLFDLCVQFLDPTHISETYTIAKKIRTAVTMVSEGEIELK
ncbi:MAG: hypothetical protein ACTJG2_03795 [Candidatus Saccharimonadales bacterium]